MRSVVSELVRPGKEKGENGTVFRASLLVNWLFNLVYRTYGIFSIPLRFLFHLSYASAVLLSHPHRY